MITSDLDPLVLLQVSNEKIPSMWRYRNAAHAERALSLPPGFLADHRFFFDGANNLWMVVDGGHPLVVYDYSRTEIKPWDMGVIDQAYEASKGARQ